LNPWGKDDGGKKIMTNKNSISFNYSRTFAPQVQMSWNQKPMQPILVESFPKIQEHDMKHLSCMDLITTNYLAS
jgi:hypothetical protein